MLTFSFCIIFPISSLQTLYDLKLMCKFHVRWSPDSLCSNLICADIKAGISLQGTSAGKSAANWNLDIEMYMPGDGNIIFCEYFL